MLASSSHLIAFARVPSVLNSLYCCLRGRELEEERASQRVRQPECEHAPRPEPHGRARNSIKAIQGLSSWSPHRHLSGCVFTGSWNGCGAGTQTHGFNKGQGRFSWCLASGPSFRQLWTLRAAFRISDFPSSSLTLHGASDRK